MARQIGRLTPISTDPQHDDLAATLRELHAVTARQSALLAELAVQLERQEATHRARLARLTAGSDYLTADEIARRLSVSSDLVRTLMARGELERVYVGTKPLVPRESFERFVAELPREVMERE